MTAAGFWDGVAWLRERWRRYGVAACCVAALVFVAHFRQFTIQYCAVCASVRHTDAWGFGLGPGRGFTLSASDDVRASAAFRDLCDADHVHVWRTDHIWDARLFSGSATCGGWSVGPFAFEYEHSDELRAIVRREIESGSLDRATALRLVAVPRRGWESDRAAPGTLPDAALLATAERLLRAHYAPKGKGAEADVAYRLRRMGGARH